MNDESDGLVATLRNEVADDLAHAAHREMAVADRRELARKLTMSRLQGVAADRVAIGAMPLDPMEEQRLAVSVLDALFGLGRLQALVDDPDIENIDVNGYDGVWITYSDGTKEAAEPVALSDDELVSMLRSAAARFGLSERRLDLAHPELDLTLPDGSRLSALISVVKRPVVSIRRHRFKDLTLDDLVALKTLSPSLARFLASAVRARKNIVIGGAMNSGKTTLIRALSSAIPPRERIVTIEQTFELGLDADRIRHPDLVALESRTANAEGVGEISMARLVRRALRMNADRVVVGEVLGDEVLPMLNAMSQGRSGSMCTIHADSSLGVFRRLASYAVQAPERLPLEATNILIAGAVHFVVFIESFEMPWSPREVMGSGREQTVGHRQLGERGLEEWAFPAVRRRRLVSSVREVVDADGLHVVSNEVFRPDRDQGVIAGAPLRSNTMEELANHGFDPSDWRSEVGLR